jgi:hypothetical protein
MTTAFKVLKFSCSDGSQVLVQATSKGNKPLDLKLVGTEGSAAYRVTCKGTSMHCAVQANLDGFLVKQDRIASLRVKNCPVTESEWEEILEAVFQLRAPPDIQATSAVEPDTSIALTIRKIIQGTTVSLYVPVHF